MEKTVLNELEKVASQLGATIKYKEKQYREIVTFTFQRESMFDGEKYCYTEEQRLYIYPATDKDRKDVGMEDLIGIFDDRTLNSCWTRSEEAQAVSKCLIQCNYISNTEYDCVYDYVQTYTKGGKK